MRRRLRQVGFATVSLAALAAGAVAYAQPWGTASLPDDRMAFAGPEARGLQEVAAALAARERALELREESLESRERDLRKAEERVGERISELAGLRAQIEGGLAALDEQQEEELQRLVRMVEAMRARDAAGLVSSLDPDRAVLVVRRMNRTKAGKLLGAMAPAVAADIAGRMTAPVPLDAEP